MNQAESVKKLLRDPEMLKLLARLAPRRGSGVTAVTISMVGENGVTLTADDGDRFRRLAKLAKR